MFRNPEPARRGSQMVQMTRMGCGSHQARQRVMDDFVKALNGAKGDLDAWQMQQ